MNIKKFCFLTLSVTTLSICSNLSAKEITKSHIIFEDNFEQTGKIPDPTKWELCEKSHPNWCRYNSESYDQAYVEDGKLILKAEKVDGEYKTGAIRMLNDLGFEFCTVEVTAKFDRMGHGQWPGIWMMPAKPLYGGWPDSGEIDIMEHLGADDDYWSTVHSKYTYTLNHTEDPLSTCKIPFDKSKWNTYGVEWNENEVNFYLNGEKTFSYPNLHLSNEAETLQWPFDTTFYLILNIALGGEGTWPGYIEESALPGIMYVDKVIVSK